MTKATIEHWPAGTFTDAQLQLVTELHFAAFDRKGRTVEQYADKLRPLWQRGEGPLGESAVLHVVRDPRAADRLIGKAISFVHTVSHDGGGLDVIALGGVASHPDARGMGVGRAVTVDVFARVDRGDAPLSLFQTGAARGFYEKLNCGVVDNRFVNSLNTDAPEARPWFDEVAMIYPADAGAWPDGTIDLLGPAW